MDPSVGLSGVAAHGDGRLLLDGCVIFRGTYLPHLLVPATGRLARERFPRLGYGTEGCDDPGGCPPLFPLGVLSFPDE